MESISWLMMCNSTTGTINKYLWIPLTFPYHLTIRSVTPSPPRSIQYFITGKFWLLIRNDLILRIITGLFLGINYMADTTTALLSVTHIGWDVNCRWIIWYLCANVVLIFVVPWDWPWIHYVAHPQWPQMHSSPPASASSMPGSQACITVPG